MWQQRTGVAVCVGVLGLAGCSKGERPAKKSTGDANRAAMARPTLKPERLRPTRPGATRAAMTRATPRKPPVQRPRPKPRVTAPDPTVVLNTHLAQKQTSADACFAWSDAVQTLVCHHEEEQNHAERMAVVFYDRRGHAREYDYYAPEDPVYPGTPEPPVDKAQAALARKRLAAATYRGIKLSYKALAPNKSLAIGGVVLSRKRRIRITRDADDIQDVSGLDHVNVVCKGRKRRLHFGSGVGGNDSVDAGFGATDIQAAVLPNGAVILVLEGRWSGEGISGSFTTTHLLPKGKLCP